MEVVSAALILAGVSASCIAASRTPDPQGESGQHCCLIQFGDSVVNLDKLVTASLVDSDSGQPRGKLVASFDDRRKTEMRWERDAENLFRRLCERAGAKTVSP
jgi:hypothetical protein